MSECWIKVKMCGIKNDILKSTSSPGPCDGTREYFFKYEIGLPVIVLLLC